MKPLGLQVWTLHEYSVKDFFGTLKEIAAIGYKGVEMDEDLYGKEPAEIRKVLDDLGLIVPSAHPGLMPTRDNVNEIVDRAKALGYDMIVSSGPQDNFKTLDGIGRLAEAYQTAAALLKPYGLRMCYHNHWWDMASLDGRPGLEIFFELATDVWAQVDVYWASNFGAVDVPALIARYGSRIPILHIKDGPLVKDQPMTAVGAGKMDIAACVEAADPSVLEWLIVEIDRCATDMLEAVRESCNYMTSHGLVEGSA